MALRGPRKYNRPVGLTQTEHNSHDIQFMAQWLILPERSPRFTDHRQRLYVARTKGWLSYLYYDQQATDGYIDVGSPVEEVKKDVSYITHSIYCQLSRTTSVLTYSSKAPTFFGNMEKGKKKKHPTTRGVRLALTRCRLRGNNHLGGKAPLLLTSITQFKLVKKIFNMLSYSLRKETVVYCCHFVIFVWVPWKRRTNQKETAPY